MTSLSRSFTRGMSLKGCLPFARTGGVWGGLGCGASRKGEVRWEAHARSKVSKDGCGKCHPRICDTTGSPKDHPHLSRSRFPKLSQKLEKPRVINHNPGVEGWTESSPSQDTTLWPNSAVFCLFCLPPRHFWLAKVAALLWVVVDRESDP